jgi:hypothetical protein
VTHSLYELLHRLDEAHIHYAIARNRPDTVTVTLTVVGERVEVDVFDDGHMEVSRFPGSEAVVGDAALVDEIIAENAE